MHSMVLPVPATVLAVTVACPIQPLKTPSSPWQLRRPEEADSDVEPSGDAAGHDPPHIGLAGGAGTEGQPRPGERGYTDVGTETWKPDRFGDAARRDADSLHVLRDKLDCFRGERRGRERARNVTRCVREGWKAGRP